MTWFSKLFALLFIVRNRGVRNVCTPSQERDVRGRAASLGLASAQYRFRPPDDNLIHPVPSTGMFPLLIEVWKLSWFVPLIPRALRTYLNIRFKKAVLWFVERWSDDYDKLYWYRFLFAPRWKQAPPPIFEHEDEDWAFARERLDGGNPYMIERVATCPTEPEPKPKPEPGCQLKGDVELQTQATDTDTDTDTLCTRLEEALGFYGLSCEKAVEDGHLFRADYKIVSDSLLPEDETRDLGRDSRWRSKYSPAPVAYFLERARAGSTELVPLVISIDQPGAAPPTGVYSPANRGWRMAKAYLRVADANVAEHVQHNPRHHYVAEAFALATRRRLAINHPVHVLLRPHLAHSIMVNSVIYGTLTKRNKSVETQFAGDLPESREMMSVAWKAWSWNSLKFDVDLARRGMDGWTGDYPWRDDLRLWEAPIRAFVQSILERFYVDDASVLADPELNAWAAELASPTGGNLEGLTIKGRQDLYDVVSEFLFIAGPSHAAVHFTLEHYLPWAPAFPRSAYKPPPKPNAADDEHWRKMLPSPSRAADQFQIGHFSGYRFGLFGDYRRYALGRLPEAKGPTEKLRSELDVVEATIRARNATRPRDYTYVLPSRVPNSVNL